MLISFSIQDLRPPTTQHDDPNSPFVAPRHAIWVNLLLFSSLIIINIVGSHVILLQAWMRWSLKLTQPPALGKPHMRARLRELIFGGNDPHILWATDVALPTIIHIFFFIFFPALLIQLRSVNHIVFRAAVVWVALYFIFHAYIMVLPIFEPTNPHFAPLSSMLWQMYYSVRNIPNYFLILLHLVLRPTESGNSMDTHNIGSLNSGAHCYYARLSDRLEAKVIEKATKQSSILDARILEFLLNNLGEDSARETFFDAIPGFFGSAVVQVEDVQKHLSPNFLCKFQASLEQFLDQNLSSNSISGAVRGIRIIKCLNATIKVLPKDRCQNICWNYELACPPLLLPSSCHASIPFHSSPPDSSGIII